MFNSVEFVRQICHQRKIAVSQLEKDCGFSNGYLNPKKMTTLPYHRAKIIGAYLSISPEMILTGHDPEPRRPDILEYVDVAFYGDFKELDEDDQETVRDMVRLMRQRKQKRTGQD